MGQEPVALKEEGAGDKLPGQDPGQPQDVVGPHLPVGDGIELVPQGDGFGAGSGLSGIGEGQEYLDQEMVAIGEGKIQGGPVFGLLGHQADFFLRFPDGGGGKAFTTFQLAPGTVDLALTQAAEFPDQHDPVLVHNEADHGVVVAGDGRVLPGPARGSGLRFVHWGHRIPAMAEFVQDGGPEGLQEGLPRAEELLARVYAGIVVAREAGRQPERIYLSPGWYRRIQQYRQSLGSLEDPGLDYLGSSSLFGLEIYLDGERDFLVV